MPDKDIVWVPHEEMRRTLEALDRRRTHNRARAAPRISRPVITRSLTLEEALQPRKEPIKVSTEEMRRTLADIDRRRAQERVIQRQQASQRTTIQAKPRERQLATSSQEGDDESQSPSRSAIAAGARSKLVTVSPEEVRRTLEDIERQRPRVRAYEIKKKSPQADAITEHRNMPDVVSPEEMRRTLEVLERQHPAFPPNAILDCASVAADQTIPDTTYPPNAFWKR
ncbi:hypothetical protein QQZ08_005140 [Neonectria magnoliae]|uniref:Uncharacterized protein n=1 Tax=Neonectria magnoliae TaxID=2732573 RepID=A0ABR1I4A8_9HYPO